MVDLHYLETSARTGIARYSTELADGLERIGEPVHRFPIHPKEVKVFGRTTGGYASVALQSWWRPLRKRDVLHSTHLYAAHPRADVVTVHDVIPEKDAHQHSMKGLDQRYFRYLFRRVEGRRRRKAHYITPTEWVKRTFLEVHPEVDPERVHVTYEGIAPSFRPLEEGEAPHAAFGPETFNVFFVGDLAPRKRLDWLLQAAADVDDPALRVFHVGRPFERRAAWAEQHQRELAQARRLGNRLVALGHVPQDELELAYRSADLLVSPSTDEGFGFPPLEAMRSGTPAAVTDIPVFREVLRGHATFFKGPEELADVLRAAMRNGKPRAAERARAHAFVRDTYTWDGAARRTRDVYRLVG